MTLFAESMAWFLVINIIMRFVMFCVMSLLNISDRDAQDRLLYGGYKPDHIIGFAMIVLLIVSLVSFFVAVDAITSCDPGWKCVGVYSLMGEHFRLCNYILLGYFLIITATQMISWPIEIYSLMRAANDPFNIQEKQYWFELWLGRKSMLKLENWRTVVMTVGWFVILLITHT
jgi:hypothetical protein